MWQILNWSNTCIPGTLFYVCKQTQKKQTIRYADVISFYQVVWYFLSDTSLFLWHTIHVNTLLAETNATHYIHRTHVHGARTPFTHRLIPSQILAYLIQLWVTWVIGLSFNKPSKTYQNLLIMNANQETSQFIDDLVQDCSNSITKALELPQSYAKPSRGYFKIHLYVGNTGGIFSSSLDQSHLLFRSSTPWDGSVVMHPFTTQIKRNSGLWSLHACSVGKYVY